MSALKINDKRIFEKLFTNEGYVLDFNDPRFEEFFREYGINIEEEKYHFKGRSKMNRLRAFWEIEPNNVVGTVLQALLEYANAIKEINPKLKLQAEKIICRLLDQNYKSENTQEKEDAFLKQEFKDISIHKLNIDRVTTEVIEQRMEEIKKCLKSKSPLATILLCGSTLEGILLDIASNHQQLFKSANSSPKDNKGKVLKFQHWTLSHFIDVAKEVGFLKEDVKRLSHGLRNFRNYIHPHQQATEQFNPDDNTAKICFQILKVAIHQITQHKV